MDPNRGPPQWKERADFGLARRRCQEDQPVRPMWAYGETLGKRTRLSELGADQARRLAGGGARETGGAAEPQKDAWEWAGPHRMKPDGKSKRKSSGCGSNGLQTAENRPIKGQWFSNFYFL